jgi:hypothetical protein
MSLSSKKNVRQTVEKYRKEFPTLERPLLRQIIRKCENLTRASELKALDRALKKAYDQAESQPQRDPRDPFENMTLNDLVRTISSPLTRILNPTFCHLALNAIKEKHPEYYRKNKKIFDDLEMTSFGFNGFIEKS